VSTLNLKHNVDVIVNIAPRAAFRRAFNLMCIIGSSIIIPAVERVRQYYSTDEMLSDGWTSSHPEFVAAQLAFSQSPAPNRVMIGRQDLTASQIRTVTINAAGTGYHVDDVLTVVQAGGSAGTLKVTEVNSGAVTGVEILTPGTGYALGTDLVTSVAPTGGTGCKIDITAIGESPLVAFQACRAADIEWYAGMVCGIKNDYASIEAIAAYVEAAMPTTVFGYNTDQASVISSATTDIMSVLKAELYRRTIGQYSTDPDQDDAIAAILGYAMGANNGTVNSAYTLDFKRNVGLLTEDVTATQFGYITGKNGNVYINRGTYYNWFQNGTMSDGSWFDEVINLDKLANDIQLNVADLLNQVPKVPQTEAGVNQIVSVINSACAQAVKIGFIAPGRWTGPTILNLNYGDTLPQGYLVQSEPIADQAQADRDARKAPPIYVAVKLAGAIQQVTIRVDVNR
jgi:hypothetical protein